MTVPATAFIAPEIKVNGVLLDDTLRDALTSVRVQTELCLVGRATLTFNDMGYALAQGSSLGLGADIAIQIDDTPVFQGIITGSSLEHDQGSVPRLVITADDAGFRLGLTQRMQPWVRMTSSDIISQIAKGAGLVGKVDADTERNEYIVQRTSDLAFVEMLVSRLNRVWWIEGTTLIVTQPAPSGTPVVLDSLASLREFSVRASGLRPLAVDVHGWDLKQKQNIVGQARGSSAPSTASSDFVNDYLGAKPGQKLGTGSANVLTTMANPLTQGEATTLASAQVASWSASSVVARGTVMPGTPKLKLNGPVKVENVGPMSGTYTVTSIEHVYNSQGLVTHFVCGSLRPAGLVDTLGTAPGVDDGMTVRSLTTGIVTNNKDPDSLGRVKVKLAGTDDSIESGWARVMTLGGGKNRGVVFQPEINDEVVIGFERGDTRRPVVLGGLVNGQDDLASRNEILGSGGTVDYRRMTSRLGHIVEFADGESPDKKHILLQLASGTNKMRIGEDAMTIDMASGKPFTLKIGNAKIAIDAQGNVSIEGLKITLKASTEIELSATSKLTAKGIQLDLEGSGQAKLAGAMVSVEGSAQAALKGGVVMIN